MLSRDTKYRLGIAVTDEAVANQIDLRLISSTPADAAAAQAILDTLDLSAAMRNAIAERLYVALAGSGAQGRELARKINGMVAVLQAQANGDENEATPAVAASLEVQDLTYTAVTAGAAGNDITIAYVDDGTAGAETVDVVGTDIVVHMEDAASTAQNIMDAIQASLDASALVSVELTGADIAQAAAAEAPLADGEDATFDDQDLEPAKEAMGDEPMSASAYESLVGALTDAAAASDFRTSYDAMIVAVQAIA